MALVQCCLQLGIASAEPAFVRIIDALGIGLLSLLHSVTQVLSWYGKALTKQVNAMG